MPEQKSETELLLSVVIAVVSGKNAVRRNLEALVPQIDFDRYEVIVPFDNWSLDVGTLSLEFPMVRFDLIESLGPASLRGKIVEEHGRFDKRRSEGLRRSRGRIVAMTEDHAIPAEDWVYQILKVHEQPYEVIGGAIENLIDRPVNRAQYYCDFGRYGRPFRSREVPYVSDVNVAYKREVLSEIRELWVEAYHETTVHWALLELGKKLYLDNRPVVYQMRPQIALRKALIERVAWGRVFAETRVKKSSSAHRFFFAVGSLFLLPLMLTRVVRHMKRQSQSVGNIITTLPIAFLLLVCWSFGEFLGYSFSDTNHVKAALEEPELC